MNTTFRVRDNETREWCEGQYALFNKAGLHEVYGDNNQHTDDVSDTHTACFPVGRQDRRKVEIHEDDDLESHGVIYQARMDGMYTDSVFYCQWHVVEFSTLKIIPPTPKPKVLTWPDVHYGKCFRFCNDEEKTVYQSFCNHYVTFGDEEKYVKAIGQPVIKVTPTFTEVTE